jgi:hypothetical protein
MKDPATRTATIAAFFNERKHETSGVERLLRPHIAENDETDSDTEDSDHHGRVRYQGGLQVTDEQVWSTYRAIGCQTFTAWETSIHRNVDAVYAEVVVMAKQCNIDIDRLEEGDVDSDDSNTESNDTILIDSEVIVE